MARGSAEGHPAWAGRKIGAVVVDHGETSCKTPDAAEYIKRSWKRKR